VREIGPLVWQSKKMERRELYTLQLLFKFCISFLLLRSFKFPDNFLSVDLSS
jgi:hypothetical protein